MGFLAFRPSIQSIFADSFENQEELAAVTVGIYQESYFFSGREGALHLGNDFRRQTSHTIVEMVQG